VQEVLRTGPVAAWVYALAWLGIPLLFALDAARKQVLRACSPRTPLV
jgi:sodium/potassium-transporting ATPase subunit alpha